MPISVNLFQASGKRLDSRGMRGRGGSASASEMAFQSAGKSARNDLGSMAQARWLRTKRKSRQALWGRPSVETAPSRSKGSPSGPCSGSAPAFTRTVTRPPANAAWPTPRGQCPAPTSGPGPPARGRPRGSGNGRTPRTCSALRPRQLEEVAAQRRQADALVDVPQPTRPPRLADRRRVKGANLEAIPLLESPSFGGMVGVVLSALSSQFSRAAPDQVGDPNQCRRTVGWRCEGCCRAIDVIVHGVG